MKSLYVGVLLVMAGTLLLSLAAFVAISNHVRNKYVEPVFQTMDEIELESARSALKTGGPAAVSLYMQQLNRRFTGFHYLLDSRGIDFVSGKNFSAFLPRPPARESRGFVSDRYIITHESADGRYWFVAVTPGGPDRWIFAPYYLLVIGVTGVLCWLAAVGVVSPIRKITVAVDQFGKGDLAARTTLRRQDEIGKLASSFNGMAERLETLVLSERRLLQDISHELRSPLTRLKFAVRLARTASDPMTALDRVQREADRMTSLVSEIVELTRSEGDPLARRTESVPIGEVVDETVADCHLEAEVRDCDICVEGQLSSEVSGDRELLRRAIENVLRNAIRYAPSKSMVDVGLTQTPKTATITIRDYGSGVPPETLPRIFEPFLHVEEARDGKSGGMGLGLSIAKRAVQLHHGVITAENASPGLRVRIVLPLVDGMNSSSSRPPD